MRVLIPVTPDGAVDPRFGKAESVAIVDVTDGAITDWTVYNVGWDVLHDEGTEGSHHARIVRFVREHEVTHVVTAGMGAPMQNTLGKMGIVILTAMMRDARAAVELAAKDVAGRAGQ